MISTIEAGAAATTPSASPKAASASARTPVRVVDVWLLDLQQSTAGLDAVLEAAERERAEFLCTAALRRRFVVRRAARRHILGGYLGVAPEQLRFSQGPNGKPQPVTHEPLQMSCSHREELGVVAVCADAAVGVDVEALHLNVGPSSEELDPLAQVMMSPVERADFRALPAALRRTALLTTWTRKEAVVKGLGVGLSLPLDTFDVPVDPGTPPRLLARRGAARDGQQWSMSGLTLPSGYVGTVTAQGSDCRARIRSWETHR